MFICTYSLELCKYGGQLWTSDTEQFHEEKLHTIHPSNPCQGVGFVPAKLRINHVYLGIASCDAMPKTVKKKNITSRVLLINFCYYIVL